MPLSDCEVRDPRMRRTRQLLQAAFRDLMRVKSLDEISVLDIAEVATVNRATFYDHYADKFALFDAMVGGDFHRLLAERNIQFNGDCPSAILAIILAACDYLTQMHSNSEICQKHNAFQPLMDAAIVSAIKRVLSPGVPERVGTGRPSLPADFVVTAASWAIYGSVRQWHETLDRGPAEEFAPLIAELVLPLLHAQFSNEHRTHSNSHQSS